MCADVFMYIIRTYKQQHPSDLPVPCWTGWGLSQLPSRAKDEPPALSRDNVQRYTITDACFHTYGTFRATSHQTSLPVGGSRRSWRKPTQTLGEHADSETRSRSSPRNVPVLPVSSFFLNWRLITQKLTVEVN